MNPAEIRQNLRDYKFQTETHRFERYLGKNTTKSFEEIEEIFSDLFSRSTIESLENLVKDSDEHTEIERIGRKILLQISQLGFLKKQKKEISEEIEKCRNSVRVKFQNEVFSSLEVFAKIKIEENSGIRQELFARWLEAENVCSDLILEKISNLQQNAKKIRFNDLGEMFENISGVNFQDFAAKAENFLHSTETLYFNTLSEVFVQTNKLYFSDYLFLVEKLERKKLYVGDQLSFFYARLLENFGFSVGKIPQIKLKKLLSYKQTKCFSPNLPQDVYLCYSIQNGAENYFDFLKNFGKAQQHAWTSENILKRFPEFVFAPDDVLRNAYGFLFRTLLADESFIRKSFAVKDEKLEDKIIKENKFRLLFETRREILRFLVEAEVYRQEKLNFEDISQNAAENFTNNLGFKFNKEQIVFEISTKNSAQKNVRSILFAYGLREYFREKYDFEWWNKRAASEELIDFWNTAERYRAEEMASLIGFEMNFELLAESF